jgi:hypothetical protein
MTDGNGNGKKARFHGRREVSPDVLALQDRLRQLAAGETITYDELAALIGRDVRPESPDYSKLHRARRRALVEDRIVTDAVARVGVKRLDDAGIVNSQSGAIKHVRRTLHTEQLKLTSVADWNKLSAADKTRHNTAIAFTGVLMHLSEPRRIKALEGKVNDSMKNLPTAKALEMLK